MTTSLPLTADASLRRTLVPVLALVLLTLAAYASSFRGTFVFDDGLCLVDKPAGMATWWPETGKEFTTGKRRWLTHLTFVANYKLHGYRVFGYHAVNVGIHLSAGLLLFGLTRRLLRDPSIGGRFAPSANGLAFVVAALWLVHPLQTESVTYIVQRLESLAGMFFLLTLYALLRGAQARRPWGWYALAVAAVALGTGAKETMLLAPVAAILFDRAYLAATWRELIRRRGLVYLAMLPWLACGMLLVRPSFQPGSRAMGFGFDGVTPWEYLRSQPGVILHYLRLALWPDRLCLDYAWPVEHDPWRIYGLGAIIVALVVAALAAYWYRPRLGFVAFMFFFLLAPTSSFMPIRDLAFEHRMYLPLASVVILIVLALHVMATRMLQTSFARRTIPALAVGLALAALMLTTMQRNRIYHDPVEVWRDTVAKAPHNLRATYNLGLSLIHRGLAGGPAEYRRMLLADPQRLKLQPAGNAAFVIEGDLREAIDWLHRATELDPRDASSYFNIAGLYDRAGDDHLARGYYEKTLAAWPGHLNARLNLAVILGDQEEYAAAETHLREAMKLAPRDYRPCNTLGQQLARQGRHEEAAACFRQAIERAPGEARPRYELAQSLWQLGLEREAIDELRALRRTHPQLIDVQRTLARYLLEARDPAMASPAESAVLAQQVVATKPDADVWYTLAAAQLALERYREAEASIREAMHLANETRDAQTLESLRALQQQLPSFVDQPAVD